MAIGLRLRNKSTGEELTFRFEGDINDPKWTGETVKTWLDDHLPEVSKLVTEENFVGLGDWSEMGMIVATYFDTSEDIKEFLDRRNADAEWDIPEGMLFVDWLACMNIICTDIDYEAIDFDETKIWVCEYDAECIDWACERLIKEGRHLTCHKHIFKDCLERVFEDEVIQ